MRQTTQSARVAPERGEARRAAPSGAAGSASALKFSAIGAAAETTIASATGVELVAACAGDVLTGQTDVQSTANDGAINITTIESGTDDVDANYDDNFDNTDEFELESNDDEVMGMIEFQSVGQATVMMVQYATGDGNDAPPGADCAIWGTYSVA